MRHPLLDPLRGFAALWVFGHHLLFLSGREDGSRVLALGYFGVPVFFVISGYCLTAAARRAIQTQQPPTTFLLRRLARVYPPFWSAVVVAVVVYAFGPSHWSRFVGDEWRSFCAGDWLGIGLLTRGLRPTGELPWRKFGPINIAFWTLAIEVQFYAVVSLATLLGRRFYPFLGIVTLAGFAFLLDPVAYVSGWYLPHWPFFALGLGVYAVIEKFGVPKFRVCVLAPAVALMGVGLAQAPSVPDGQPRMVAAEFAFAVGVALVVWLGQSFPPTRFLKPFAFLGTISYSVYLLHVPLLMIGMDWATHVAPFGSTAWGVLIVVGVCAVSVPFHFLIERPFLSAGAKKPVSQSKI